MQGPFQRIITGTIFFVTTSLIAVIGYSLSGWSLLDSIYMVVITIFGVGYGEVKPLDSPALKIFTIFMILGGTTSAIYLVGGFVQMVMEGEVNRALDDRRMIHKLETLEQHVIICGFGRIGQILAREMVRAKQPFVVIDSNPERVAEAKALGYIVEYGNATEEAILEASGIERAKVLATVLPDDAINVFITLTARGLNPQLVIMARGESPTTEKKLRLAGADHVVLPATIGALHLAHLIAQPETLDSLEHQNADSHQLNELLAHLDVQIDDLVISPNSPLVGKTIGEVEVDRRRAFIIVALRHADGTTITRPNQALILSESDTLVVIGHRHDLQPAKVYAQILKCC